MLEERKILPDVFDRKVVRVGENISRNSTPTQFSLHCHHRRDFAENVRKIAAKFLDGSLKTGRGADLVIKLLPVDLAAFVLDEQR